MPRISKQVYEIVIFICLTIIFRSDRLLSDDISCYDK